jgi:rfaE bifunctional protein kinase chain/domain
VRVNDIRRELLSLLPRLAGHRVLVVGDLFLDEYVLGQATRLSREAPIPVLEFVRRFFVPGGAANPAHNICTLGSQATVLGLVGDDEAGRKLLIELQTVGIDPTGLVVDDSRPTTIKTRILAEGSLRFPQQVARVDHLSRERMRSEVEASLVGRIKELAPQVDAVLVSDYQTAVASPAVVQAALQAARDRDKPCTVDAQGSFDKYTGFDLIKGNRQEIEMALSRTLQSDKDYRQAGEALLERLSAKMVIVTRGEAGLALIARDGTYEHFAAANRTEVFDVTGAGDTVIAIATLALVAGGSAAAAAALANLAAGCVVRKLGNVAVTADELAWAVKNW